MIYSNFNSHVHIADTVAMSSNVAPSIAKRLALFNKPLGAKANTAQPPPVTASPPAADQASKRNEPSPPKARKMEKPTVKVAKVEKIDTPETKSELEKRRDHPEPVEKPLTSEKETPHGPEDSLHDEQLDISKFCVDRSKFRKRNSINHGSFGRIYLCTDAQTGEVLAMKKIQTDGSNWSKLSYEREIAILGNCSYPSILQLVGCTPWSEDKDPVIYMPYMPNGSIHDMIKKESQNKCPPEWSRTRKHIVLYGVARGMAYIRKHNIIHRDLKPGNILLDENLEPKITDFGMSKHVEAGQTNQQSVRGGTNEYMAPEIYRGEKFNYKVDVFAFGMVMYAVLSGKLPFSECNGSPYLIYTNIVEHIMPKIPKSVAREYQEIIQSCWQDNPQLRPEFDEICAAFCQPALLDAIDRESFSKYQEKLDMAEEDQHPEHTSETLSDYVEPEEDESPDDEDWLPVSEFYVNPSDYQKIRRLGAGAQGMVLLMESKKTHEQCARKKVLYAEYDEFKRQDYEREVRILGNMRHPALLELVGCTPYSAENPWILTKFMKNGSVHDMIEKESRGACPPEWTSLRKHIVLYGTACGMAYLHKRRVIHRDLKPANILLDDNFEPKIADFGMAKHVAVGLSQAQSRIVGTPVFMAPETTEGVFDWKVDVFAFAVIMYCVIAGKYPDFRGNSFELMSWVRNGGRPSFPGNFPAAYQSIIEKCWEGDPEARPTFDEIVNELAKVRLGEGAHEFAEYEAKLRGNVHSAADERSSGSKSTKPTTAMAVKPSPTVSAASKPTTSVACDLNIHVEKAEGLVIGPKCGTYVRIKIKGTTSFGKTKTIWNNNNPKYRDDIDVTSKSANSDVLVISLLMKISGRDESVCEKVRIPVKDFEEGMSEHVLNLKKNGQGAGTLHLNVHRLKITK